MSCPIDVYFIRNSEVVGVGRGNLGIAAEDTRIPCAIFDAWHNACERFEDEPECGRMAMDRFLEKYAHLFTTRSQLFEYQHVMIPSRRVIISRRIVVDLLTQRLTSSDFASIINSPEFELTDRTWEAVMERTRIRGMHADPTNKPVQSSCSARISQVIS